MPIFVVNGKRYRVRFLSLLNGSEPITEDPLPPSRKRGKSAVPDLATDRTWTREEDRLLWELKTCHIPWKYVSVAMGHRPVAQLKRRWYYLRDRRPVLVDSADWLDQPDAGDPWEEEAKVVGRSRRRVSFADPLTTVREVDESYYDEDDSDDLTPKEVLLLHRVATKWEKDRWVAISNRFNNKTGHSLTPEQAKWIINN